MKTLVLSSSFKRAFKAKVKHNINFEQKLKEKLQLLVTDPFNPILRTHKLKGNLSGIWSCTIDYDCRLVFKFIPQENSDEEEILLINIGTHDEVY